jgi:hypothetical protein
MGERWKKHEIKNIKFGDIPESMFELPAGVQIKEMPMGMH